MSYVTRELGDPVFRRQLWIAVAVVGVLVLLW
jgi:hypothetical protein